MDSPHHHRRKKSKRQGLMNKKSWIPEELVTIVLMKLPVKSLVKFRCVSKTWLSIISTPQFIQSHRLSTTSRSLFSLIKKNQLVYPRIIIPSSTGHQIEILQPPPVYFIDDRILLDGHSVPIYGSCNGLVCALVDGIYPPPLVQRRIIHDDPPYHQLILWNPATHKFHQLPHSGIRTGFNYIQCGFGYDASTDDYKLVVSGGDHYSSSSFHHKIYSLRSNSWKHLLLTNNNLSTIHASHATAVFLKGALHWRLKNHDIVAINLTTEAAFLIDPPDIGLSYMYTLLGAASQDRLCLCYSDIVDSEYWMMQDYGIKASWTKIMRYSSHSALSITQVSWFQLPEYQEGCGRSPREWKLETVCQFDEIPSTRDYIKFAILTYSETLVSPTPPIYPALASSQIG